MPNTDPILSLRDVGKRYVKYEDVPTLVTGVLNRRWRNKRTLLWALRHINLDVARGEAVGVIGRNGAGKSTMLGMLAGVTAPTEGVVTVKGRVAPLLRLGIGFHEELTGRENVHINASILGLSEPEIEAVFDEIVEFAELEQFIDTPVKFYSSGMQARLGFSVAIATNPDILLVDEILAVGDAAFQMRSFDRMLELQKAGTTILVVSHNLDAIRRVCTRVLVLNQGATVFEGDPSEALSEYHELLRVGWDQVSPGVEDGTMSHADEAPLEVLDMELIDDDGRPGANYESGTGMTVRFNVRFRRSMTDPSAGLWVTNKSSQLVYAMTSLGTPSGRFEAGATANLDIRLALHLVSGTYAVGGWVGWQDKGIEHVRAPAKHFYVSGPMFPGVADLGGVFSAAEAEPGPSTPSPTDSREAASDPRSL